MLGAGSCLIRSSECRRTVRERMIVASIVGDASPGAKVEVLRMKRVEFAVVV